MGLDSQTLLLVGGCLYVLLPLNTWLVLSEPRSKATQVWCMGGFLGGVALCLMAMRGVIPDLLSYTAYSLLVMSILLLTQSMRMDMGRPWRLRWVVLVGLAHGVVVTLLMNGQWADELAVLVRACNLLALSLAVLTAVHLARRERSANAWMIMLALALMGAAVFSNLLASVRGESSLNDLRSGTGNLLVGLSSMAGALLSNMGYLGLQLERTLAYNTQALQSRERATRRTLRRRQLVVQERPLTVGVLADSLAHALLQPLAALVIQTQLGLRSLRKGDVDAVLLGEVLGRARVQLERIGEQIEHIRKFIQPRQATVESVDICRVIRDVEPLVRQEAINQKVKLVLQLPLRPVKVSLEPLSLMQAVLQVLRNAMTAASAQGAGEVRVTLAVSQDTACIHVQDSGPGFAPDLLLQLQRGHAPALGESTGLGLWMVRRIMATCGGRLELDNSPDGGAHVQLCCPLEATEPVVVRRA